MNYSESPRFVGLLIATLLISSSLEAIEPRQVILPEQRRIQVRLADQMRPTRYASSPRPATVTEPQAEIPEQSLPLNEAINIALQNSEVVRVLTGFTASTSGRTIYDVAIANAGIDQSRAAFDPQLRINQAWNANKIPTAVPNGIDPTQSDIIGDRSHTHVFDFGLSKQNQLGGVADLSVNSIQRRFPGDDAPLDPQNGSNVDLSYTQPLLQGAGLAVNQAPIVLARIETERSYFQYKDSVQRLVQGVIQAYWALVFAKTDLWAREQQVKQAQFAFQRTKARLEAGDANSGELAQSKLALENFRATLLASQSDVLQRQAALTNILGYPPYEPQRLTPVTPMVDQLIQVDWELINELAARQRPDVIELKLILDADRQRLLQADNQARPRLDVGTLYRWNGLEGEVPAGNRIRSESGEFDDWAMTVNFSVPLGLRRERATLRQQQLLIRRDQANLDQGLHAMQHLLALSLRNIEQFYAQYERFKSVRDAAEENLELQLSRYNEGVESFIVVLQAIVDWGNSVSSEAQALSQYNIELATLELETGTILESHGVVFYEERFQSIGPYGRCGNDRCYPKSIEPSDQVARYESGDRPAEENFDLEDPVTRRGLVGSDQDRSIDPESMEEVPEFSEEGDEPMTDEEINELIDGGTKSGWLPMFWKNPFRRWMR